MTIRYTCTDCESVLKIKDEKAGTKARCPKCKAEFIVPAPDDAESEVAEAVPKTKSDTSPEVTPPPVAVSVPKSPAKSRKSDADEEFDPLSFLADSEESEPKRPGASPERKASVADMMRDFSPAKKSPEPRVTSEAPRGSATAAETAGSAADALSRAYQQKRASASAPAPLSAKELKKAEERALLRNFLLTRAIPGVLLVVGSLYAYFSWMMSETYEGPVLYSVTGQILKGSSPAVNYNVVFEPVISSPDDSRGAAIGKSDAEGKFELMYRDPWMGAPAGQYRIGVANEKGEPVATGESALILNVNENGSNDFKINL